jgi:hypothetical protein
MAMVQNVLFFRRKLTAFAFAHAGSLKRFSKHVPQKLLTSYSQLFLPLKSHTRHRGA